MATKYLMPLASTAILMRVTVSSTEWLLGARSTPAACSAAVVGVDAAKAGPAAASITERQKARRSDCATGRVRIMARSPCLPRLFAAQRELREIGSRYGIDAAGALRRYRRSAPSFMKEARRSLTWLATQ